MSFILGTMNIHYPYSSNIQKTYQSYKEIVEKYISLSDNPIIDTAYYYGNTKTEEILGDILKDINTNKKITIATKANPWYENDFTNGILGQLSKENIERQLTTSLKNLDVPKVDIFYLHCPDHNTPLKETLMKCNDLWRQEKFDYLGISNYSNKQLQSILDICDYYHYTKPKYYQGMYNLISRSVEEIFPTLDDYNMEFWAYNPLAGGLLTGKYRENINIDNTQSKFTDNTQSRFKDNTQSRFKDNTQSRFKDNSIYQNIFWKDEIIKELDNLFVLNNPIEKSYHWLLKYSKLRKNDKIILGVSTLEQLDNNINILNKNILFNHNIIQKLDNIYTNIKEFSPNYYY
jgi:aflatoxin B1 aldehyde reductase